MMCSVAIPRTLPFRKTLSTLMLLTTTQLLLISMASSECSNCERRLNTFCCETAWRGRCCEFPLDLISISGYFCTLLHALNVLINAVGFFFTKEATGPAKYQQQGSQDDVRQAEIIVKYSPRIEKKRKRE